MEIRLYGLAARGALPVVKGVQSPGFTRLEYDVVRSSFQ